MISAHASADVDRAGTNSRSRELLLTIETGVVIPSNDESVPTPAPTSPEGGDGDGRALPDVAPIAADSASDASDAPDGAAPAPTCDNEMDTPAALAPADLMSADFLHVDRRYITTETIGWVIPTAITGVGGAITLLVLSLNAVGPLWLRLLLVGVWSAFMLMMVWLTMRYPRWQYERTRYRLSERGIEIHTGVVWRQVINVPRARVQHTDVAQGPLMRRYGLATLIIHTAGTQNSTVTLPGLTHEIALGLRDFLLQPASNSSTTVHAAVDGAVNEGNDDSEATV